MWPALAVFPVRRLTSVVSDAIRPERIRRKFSLPRNRSFVDLNTCATSSPSSTGLSLLFVAVLRVFTTRTEPVNVLRVKSAADDQVEQLLDARIFLRADTQDGHEFAGGDRVVGGLAQLVRPDRLAFKVTHHQLFVGLDDLFDDDPIGFGRRQGTLGRVFVMLTDHVDDSLKRRALTDRHVKRHALGAEGFANRLQIGAVVDVFGIHLRDDEEPAEAKLFGLLVEPSGVDFQSGRPAHREHDVLHRRERARA